MPLPISTPTAAPTRASTTTKAATSAMLRRLFDAIWSYMEGLRQPPADVQNSTVGAVRAASSASKYSRCSNFSIRAKYIVGNCWSLLL